MRDSYDRSIDYLRISVTDLCNLRCTYCMPEHGVEKADHSRIISVDKIEEIVKICAGLGTRKVRLTGGEPLVRRGIIEICHRISAVPGIEELCITTNGILLKKYAHDLKLAGVDRLNVSLDTLDEEKYKKLTRCVCAEHPIRQIFEGIEAAKKEDFGTIKINTVLLGGVNDDEIRDLVELTKEEDFQVRFIELMPIGEAKSWDKATFIPNSTVLEKVPELVPCGESGVAHLYNIPGYKGMVGLISPLSNHFCSTCNRLRLTADGKLKACLHSNKETSVIDLEGDALREAIINEIKNKPRNYDLSVSNPSSSDRNMNQIGG